MDDSDDRRESEARTDFLAMVEASVTGRFLRNLVLFAVGVRIFLVLWALALCAAGLAGKHPASISVSALVSAGLFGVVIGVIVTQWGKPEFLDLRDTSVLFTAVLLSWKWAAAARHADWWACLRVPELQAVAVIAVAVLLGTSSLAFSAGIVYVATVLTYFWIVGAIRTHVAAS